MADLPTKSNLTSSLATESEFAGAIGDLFDYVQQLVVGSDAEALAIINGVITPTKTYFTVDTENDTASDNLDNMAATNIGQKIIILKIESSARAVTIRHARGGSGQFNLVGGADLTVDNASYMVAFRYRTAGDTWDELWRNFGLTPMSDFQKAAARTAMGLGTASTLAFGTGAGQLPRNQDLGALATQNTVDGAGQIMIRTITKDRLADGSPGKFLGFGPDNHVAELEIPSGTPAGVVVSYAGTTAPSGWLMCYGQAVSRTGANAALFNTIGIAFGPGDGANTFNVPDYRGRGDAGKDDMGGVAAARITNTGVGTAGLNGTVLGAAGGADRYTLTSGQLPVTNVNVRQNMVDGGAIGAGFVLGTSGRFTVAAMGSFGSGEAHPSLPPTMIMNKIIKL